MGKKSGGSAAPTITATAAGSVTGTSGTGTAKSSVKSSATDKEREEKERYMEPCDNVLPSHRCVMLSYDALKKFEFYKKYGAGGGDIATQKQDPVADERIAGPGSNTFKRKDNGTKDVGGDDGFHQPVETVPFPLSAAKKRLNRLKALHKERRQRRRERNSQMNKSSHGNNSKHVPTDPASNKQSLADGRDSSPRLGSNSNGNGTVQPERMGRQKLSESSKKKGGGGGGDGGSTAPAVTATPAGSTRSG